MSEVRCLIYEELIAEWNMAAVGDNTDDPHVVRDIMGFRADARPVRKVRENRLRRMAARQGLALSKCRRRDPHALGYGGWMIFDPCTTGIVDGGDPFPYSLNLDDVEKFLTDVLRSRRVTRADLPAAGADPERTRRDGHVAAEGHAARPHGELELVGSSRLDDQRSAVVAGVPQVVAVPVQSGMRMR